MITTEIKKWFIDNEIEKRTIQYFWDCYKNNKHEIMDKFGDSDDRLIEVKIKKVEFTIIFDYDDFVYSILDIYYNGELIGTYKVVYTLEGECVDDIFYFEDEDYVGRLVAECNKSIEIAENSLKEGLESEMISKITGLNPKIIEDTKQKLKK